VPKSPSATAGSGEVYWLKEPTNTEDLTRRGAGNLLLIVIRVMVLRECVLVWVIGSIYIGGGASLDKYRTKLYKIAFMCSRV